MNNLAGTYHALGQMKEAAALHEKVLEARRRTLGDEHPDTLLSMNNLAGTYCDLGQIKEAACTRRSGGMAKDVRRWASGHVIEHEQSRRDIWCSRSDKGGSCSA